MNLIYLFLYIIEIVYIILYSISKVFYNMNVDSPPCSYTNQGHKRWQNTSNSMKSLSDIRSHVPVQLFETCNVVNQQFFSNSSSTFKTKTQKSTIQLKNHQNCSSHTGSSVRSINYDKENTKKEKLMAKIFRNKSEGLLEIFTVQLLELCLLQTEHLRNNKKIKSNKKITFQDQNGNKYLQSLYQLLQKPQFQLQIPPNCTGYSTTNHNILSQHPQKILKQLLYKFLSEVIEYPTQKQNHLDFSHNHTHTQSISYSFRQTTTTTAIITLNSYPLILDIFVALFRGLLVLGDVCESFHDQLEMQSTYDFLASYFGVQASIDTHNKCVYFQQTGVYVLEQDQSHLFMIYKQKINQEKTKQGTQFSISQDSQIKHENMSVMSDQFSQIDAEQFSKILNNNIKDTQNTDNDHSEGNVIVISSIDIEDNQSTQERKPVGYQACDFVQSEIINNSGGIFKSIKNVKFSNIIQDGSINLESKKQIININLKPFSHKKLKTFRSQQFNFPQKPTQTPDNVINSSFNVFKQQSVNSSVKDFLKGSTLLKTQFIETQKFEGLMHNNGFRKQKKRVEQIKSPGQKQNIKKGILKCKKEVNKKGFNQQMFQKLMDKVFINTEKPSQGQRKGQNLKQLYQQTTQTFYNSENSCKKGQKVLQSTICSSNFNSTNHSIWKPMITNNNKIIPWINKDISKQFTNSFVLKSVEEPFRSNVKKLKQRARQQRRKVTTHLYSSNIPPNCINSGDNKYINLNLSTLR